MAIQKKLMEINVIPSSRIALVSFYSTKVNQISGEAEQMQFHTAISMFKSMSATPDFPIYVPVKGNYQSSEHYSLLDAFKNGEPFVPVAFQNLKIFCQKQGQYIKYWGFADSFEVVDKSLIEY